jgi:hypothetical protein
MAHTRVYPKFSGLSHNEINNNNKHPLRSSTNGYAGKTHYTDSQNSYTTASSDIELRHFQFSLQTASPETFGYTLVSAAIVPNHSQCLVKGNVKFVLVFNEAQRR